ncbi:hypothetical protein [Flavobacterium quisquiliarum]|uniref:Uncharacterized protein n=1 Tax=Flavobacterium quisquiliarum TaxID=1834436 RepID=A0ABV8WA68_9FLAO|nr:hypothetical protein [Flavobacterium quisquiliarum]MBW1658024.1 hypothetical protein [Flavobacterium quisquiliarum]NWL01895.1 hypothetical protein [Flavobacterium collinsii]
MVSTKKYFIYIIFLVSPISLTLYAQNTAQKPTTGAGSDSCVALVENNQNNTNNAVIKNSSSDNFNQLIVRMSTPKDSLTIAAESNSVSNECKEDSSLTATSILAKDIIENYKYDFSETFIDILFFERIDLARTRTI